MQVPLEITFRNMEKNEMIEALVREKIKKLEQVCSYLTSCRIVLEKPQKHQRTGNPYRVRLDIHVPPGHTLVVKRESSKGDMHDPLHTVVRDAFRSARLQLRKLKDHQRGRVKAHPHQESMAFVTKLYSNQGYGFLETHDGQEIYFHRNSVLHRDFDRLKIGTGVRFVSAQGEKGEQASTVELVDPVRNL